MSDRNIIFLMEDNSILLEQLQEALEKNKEIKADQLKVFTCTSIESANMMYDELNDLIVCLVCDSNMSSNGLLSDLREESEGGLFSGWLWLREKIKSDEALVERSLVYSAYYDELQTVMRQTPLFRKVPCIRKKTITAWNNEEIIKEIVRIIKAQRGGYIAK